MEETSLVPLDLTCTKSQGPIKPCKSNPPKKSKTFLSSGLKDQDSQMEEYECKKSKTYYWNATENRRYIKFLANHIGLLQLSLEERKSKKVNLQMSKQIKTRTATQCHTHHQKMMARYGSLEAIIQQNKQALSPCHKKKTPILVKVEPNQSSVIKVESNIDQVNAMKSPSEILAFGPLVGGEVEDCELPSLMEQVQQPVYSASTKDLLQWIDIDAFLF